MTGTVADIALDDIEVDPERIPIRSSVHECHVEQLARRVRHDGVPLSPVLLWWNGERLLLLSGLHRLEAYRRAGRERIPAAVTRGDRKEALLRAYDELCTPGIRASAWERARALRTLHRELGEPSLRTMERLVGVGRSQLQQCIKVGRDLGEQMSSDMASSNPRASQALHHVPLKTLYEISRSETPIDRLDRLKAEVERRAAGTRTTPRNRWVRLARRFAQTVKFWLRTVAQRVVRTVRSVRIPDRKSFRKGE